MTTTKPYLVIGGRGKTGRRVVDRLAARELPVRLGSRSGPPPFDWTDRTTWPRVLDGVGAAYVTYQPDLAVPGAADALGSFIDHALDAGVRRLVLMSGRGEEEAERCERILQASGADWTVIRSSWLDQNFSESFMLDMVIAGEVALPVGDVGEPFIDAEDIAEIAVAALTDERHIGELYEVTGPRLLSFGDAVAEIGRATGHELRLIPLSREEFADGLAAEGVSGDEAWLLDYLFATVLDGRNERLANGVQRALGREPRAFRDCAQLTAASGVWRPAAGRAA